ncbi:MAG: DedA family protein [Myxococcota bacterium]
MPAIESLIREYGYWFVFGGSLLEGETVMALSGYAAHRGFLALPIVMVVGFLGATLGDQFWFQLGRYRGRDLIDSRPQWRVGIARVDRLFERWGVAVLLVFRFLYGIRSLAAVVFGAGSISTLKFTVFNSLGAVIWVATIAGGGFLLGSAMQGLLGDFEFYEAWGFAGLILFAGILWLWQWRRGRKRAV